jgi:DNA modification methylase
MKKSKTKIKNATSRGAVKGHMKQTRASAATALLQALSHQIEQVPVNDLTPYGANARTHSKKQIGQIAGSITEFGFTNPILVDAQNQIIAGHGRLAAAKKLAMDTVPVIRLAHLSPAQKRAYLLADNRLADKAGWDQEILAAEFKALIDLDFDVDLTGFDLGEIDLVLDQADGAKREPANPEDDVPEVAPGQPISCNGELWQLGIHRLVCGDARDCAVYQRLLQGEKAQFIFTDPPFNVAIDGHASRQERGHDREFAMASGEMSEEEFTGFLTGAFKHLVAHSVDGSLHDICMDWRHVSEMMAAGRTVYSELKNLCVWSKSHAGMGTFYRSRHELVFVWKAGKGPHINNLEFNENGRIRSNIWEYAGCSSMRTGRREELALHPTTKPVALVADAIRDCSHHNGIVLDPFAGSGTTLIAAERTGRRARVIEIEPRYADVIVRRWQAYTGKIATLVATGQSFEDIEAERQSGQVQGEQANAEQPEPRAPLISPDLFQAPQSEEAH